MQGPIQEVFYTVNPDVVSAAIKQSITHVTVVLSTLSGVIVVFGGVFAYIWRQHNMENRDMGERLEKGIKDLADNLKEIAKELFNSRNEHDHRLTEIEGEVRGWRRVCDERHKKITKQLLDDDSC